MARRKAQQRWLATGSLGQEAHHEASQYVGHNGDMQHAGGEGGAQAQLQAGAHQRARQRARAHPQRGGSVVGAPSHKCKEGGAVARLTDWQQELACWRLNTTDGKLRQKDAMALQAPAALLL